MTLQLLNVLAIEQPTADFGPLAGLVDKLGGLGWAIAGFAGMMGIIATVAIYIKNKANGQSSQAGEWLAGIVACVCVGALAATIINWSMNVS
ncbi:hypothetical protein AB0C65_35645 [Nocardia sp. NPDC048505]|uniref:hypothetical protein n=1 Tax=Nocardia sp. NPDC048505 TaxID=3155756 RepID=UPI0033D044B2